MRTTRQEQIALVRAELAARLDRYLRDHAQRISTEKAPPLPPLAVKATVGLGKSAAAATLAVQARALGVPILILVPTRKLAIEYAEKIPGAVVYKGRREANPNAAPSSHDCYLMQSVEDAGERHHRPAQSICRECVHGRAGAYQYGNATRQEQAIQWFRRHDITNRSEIENIRPCQFLYVGLPNQLQAQILIAPHGAFSAAAAEYRPDPHERPVQRLVFVDEMFAVSEHIKIGLSDIGKWIGWCEARASEYETGLRWRKTKDDPENQQKAQLWHHVSAELGYLAAALGSNLLPNQYTTPNGKTAGQRIIELVKLLKDNDETAGGTAAFERVRSISIDQQYKQAHDTPLRAIHALARAIKNDGVRLLGHTYSLHEPSPIIEHAIKKGSAVLMDATLDSIVSTCIEAVGGEIYSAEVPQNIRLVRYTGHMYARGIPQLKNYIYTAAAALRDAHEIARDMLRTHDSGACALITHRAYLQYADPDKNAEDQAREFERFFDGEAAIGWFGAHDRGHNRWQGRHIAVLGMPLLSPQAITEQWRARQAIAALAGLQLDDWQQPPEGEILPSNPEQRAWLCDHYAATIAQAAGRARAIHQDYEIECRLYGGIDCKDMDDALARAGLQVMERRRNTTHSSTPGRRQGASDADIVAAIADLERAGARVSVRSVAAYLRSSSGQTVDQRRVEGVLRQHREREKCHGIPCKSSLKEFHDTSSADLEKATTPAPRAPQKPLNRSNVPPCLTPPHRGAQDEKVTRHSYKEVLKGISGPPTRGCALPKKATTPRPAPPPSAAPSARAGDHRCVPASRPA